MRCAKAASLVPDLCYYLIVMPKFIIKAVSMSSVVSPLQAECVVENCKLYAKMEFKPPVCQKKWIWNVSMPPRIVHRPPQWTVHVGPHRPSDQLNTSGVLFSRPWDPWGGCCSMCAKHRERGNWSRRLPLLFTFSNLFCTAGLGQIWPGQRLWV